VLLSVSDDLMLQLLQLPPSPRSRVIIGYAGWGPGQLDKEIAASAWLTTEVDPGLIFNVGREQLGDPPLRRAAPPPPALKPS
jgi:putative transcriptional regulator